MQFWEFPRQEWEVLLPGAEEVEWDLVSKLVRFESGERLTAEQVRWFLTSCKSRY
jgi:cyclin-dependent kinase